MKRFISFVITLTVLLKALPAVAAELPLDLDCLSWQVVRSTVEGEELAGYQDADGNWAILPQFDGAEEFDDRGCALVYEHHRNADGSWDNKWGLIDQTGTVVAPLVYDWIESHPEGDHRSFKKGETCGIMDAWGKILVPELPGADSIAPVENGVAFYYVDEDKDGRSDKVGMVDMQGNILAEPIYGALYWAEGFIEARSTGAYAWGVLAPDGSVRVPVIYDSAEVVINNGRIVAEVKLGGKWGAIDPKTGEEIQPCIHTNRHTMQLAVRNGGKVYVGEYATCAERCRELGLRVDWFPEYEGLMRRYGTDRMLLVKDGKSGLFDLKGNAITSYDFDAFQDFDNNGIAMACKGGLWGAVDLDGNVKVDFLQDSVYNVGLVLENARQSHFVNQKGNVFVQGSFQDEFDPPYAVAADDGTVLTDYIFWGLRPFVNGYALASNGTGYAYIDGAGTPITPYKYSGEVHHRFAGSDFYPEGGAATHSWTEGFNLITTEGRELLPKGSNIPPYPAGHGLWGYEDPDTGCISFVDGQGNVVINTSLIPQLSMKGIWMTPVFNKLGYAAIGDHTFLDLQGNVVENPPGYDPELGNFPALMGPSPYLQELLDMNNHQNQKTDSAAPTYRRTDSEGYWFQEGLKMQNYKGETAYSGDIDGPWGFVDESGNQVVPAIFDAVGYFDHGVAAVKAGEVFGLLKNPLKKDKVSDWARAEVTAATQAGYVTESCKAYQTYTITREQFASLAVNYLEKKTGQAITPAPADTFTDTVDEAVLKAYAAGIVQGMGDGLFGPGRPLSREQLATMLWRAMEQVGAGMHYGSLNQYTDADQISDWAENAVNNLIHHEVMAGTSETTISPKASCTVEQAILLIWRAAGKEYTLPAEKEAQHQAAIDRVTVEGIEIGAPFDELPQALRAALKQEGEPYDSGVFNQGEEVGRRYKAPGIEIITSEATEKVLKRALEGKNKEYLLKYYGSEDWREVYTQMLGREYVDTVILTDDTYHMVSGLKVGDSGERVQGLGYTLAGETYSDSAGFSGSADIFMGDNKVVRIEVYDCIGRRIGAFFDP